MEIQNIGKILGEEISLNLDEAYELVEYHLPEPAQRERMLLNNKPNYLTRFLLSELGIAPIGETFENIETAYEGLINQERSK